MKNLINKVQTLHCHTTTSDGELTYLETLNYCNKINIGAVAFTDHDSLPKEKDLNLLIKNKNHSVKWIIGTELNSGWPKELGIEGIGNGFEIIGLFVDPTNANLKNHCQKAQESRILRTKKMVKNLNSLGFKITIDDCLRASGGEAVGRPHIVIALMRYENNVRIMKILRSKMEIDSLNNPGYKIMLQELKERGISQYPYALFLSPDSYIKNVYENYKYWLDFDQIVKLIREAGGLAFFPHYFSYIKTLNPTQFEKIISEKRIDGIETFFGSFAYGTVKEKEIVDSREIAKSLVKKYHVLESGGNDAHKKSDYLHYVESSWFSKATVGLAEKIIKLSKINTRWSSFN